MRRAAFAALLMLAACGGDASPIAQCPSEAPSPAATPPYDDDRELADRIPDTAGGEPLEVQTYCASTHEEAGVTVAPGLLAELGVDLADVTVARSRPPQIGATADQVEVTAWRYRGADEDRLRDAFLASYGEALSAQGMDAEITEESLGGKGVHNHSTTGVIYVAVDTLYILSGNGTKIEEILAALP